ncbi:hypothetical protein ACFX2A_024233 [Malus domestica]
MFGASLRSAFLQATWLSALFMSATCLQSGILRGFFGIPYFFIFRKKEIYFYFLIFSVFSQFVFNQLEELLLAGSLIACRSSSASWSSSSGATEMEFLAVSMENSRRESAGKCGSFVAVFGGNMAGIIVRCKPYDKLK